MAKKTEVKKGSWDLERAFPFLLIVGGAVGLLSSVVLTIEKIHLLENPGAKLSCDINPIVSCGSVIATDQASAFGLPNPLIGIAGFAGIITIGVILALGVEIRKRWFWQGLLLGTTFGVLFVHWLIFQTIFRIGALCPWCMVTWTAMIPIFLYTLIHVGDKGHLVLGKTGRSFIDTLKKEHWWVLAGWFGLILAVIGQHFWYYWQTLLP